MKKRSREFEVWAATIERALAPAGAVLKSPDRIRDKITGQLREVDASVRHRVGSCDILITIECRDRSRVQDSTWIEQLVTKQKNIGADRTIAVSATPFSQKAQLTAAMHGISLRRITDLTAQELLSSEGGVRVALESVSVNLERLTLTFEGPTQRQPDPATQAMYLAHGLDARIFGRGDRLLSVAEVLAGTTHEHRAEGDLRVTMPPKSMISMSDSPLWRHLSDVPLDGTAVTKQLSVTLDQGLVVTMQTTDGQQRVLQVEARLTAANTSTPVLPTRVSNYSDERQVIGTFTEHEIEIQGKPLKVFSHPRSLGEDKSKS